MCLGLGWSDVLVGTARRPSVVVAVDLNGHKMEKFGFLKLEANEARLVTGGHDPQGVAIGAAEGT